MFYLIYKEMMFPYFRIGILFRKRADLWGPHSAAE